MLTTSKQNKHIFVLGILFFAINFILYQKLGIKFANDSFRYLEYSTQILDEGNFYRNHDLWYLGYVLFITCTKIISSNSELIVLFQILLSGVAIFSLYFASKLLFQDELAAFVTSLTYLLFLEISYWNFYILTESFYSSMMCFSIFFVIKSYYLPTVKNILFCVFICLITFFTKPTGIALGIAIFVLLVLKHKEYILKTNKWLLYTFAILILLASYLLINRMLQTFTLIENYLIGEIVFGITTLPNYPSLKTLTIDVNVSDLSIPTTDHSPIARNLLFFICNPVFFIKLASLKLFWYLAHVKPYFSFIHNFFIAISLYPFYLLFGISFRKESIDYAMKGFFFTIVLMNCIIVSLTSEDWDGRFIIPILPVLFIVASPQLAFYLRKSRKIIK